ncbi:OpgC domain-containing protein [Ramlibacter rhizophilus]|uniref:OpgC domain-containing protein n=1 Tax=Ramlibacter rhizophilus TaxID=1781167 RepID=A0A4Z0BL93_9BURK|nr:OpgC domain-containing protein [Ramlibacter rhizophilus]TFY98688.1 OpgC domain-containing protein [Ramlibacter rhizophilus]
MSNRRRWEIDALRGLMLMLMTLTHLPTRLSEPFGQPFGLVSAAEGFVLLSGYMAGLVYGRAAVEKGVAAMRRAFSRRAHVVYLCHAALLLFLFTVIALIGIRVDEPAVKNLMAYYLQHPLDALVGGLILIYQPPLLDILPMYVIFMLVSPWALVLALRAGWAPVMAASLAVWLLAQFGLAQWLYEAVAAATPLPVPYAQTGSFHVLAWQFLWMMGLWMGASRHEPEPAPFTFPNSAVAIAAVAALVCFVWRHAVGQVPFPGNATLNLLFDKWHLGPLRLLNLMALMVLVIRFGPWLASHLPRLRFLETLGAASLAVFCAHLVVVLLTLSLFGAQQDRAWSVDVPLLAVALSSLYAAGWLTLWLEQQPPGRLARFFSGWLRQKPTGQ